MSVNLDEPVGGLDGGVGVARGSGQVRGVEDLYLVGGMVLLLEGGDRRAEVDAGVRDDLRHVGAGNGEATRCVCRFDNLTEVLGRCLEQGHNSVEEPELITMRSDVKEVSVDRHS